MADSFGIDDDMVLLAALTAVDNIVDECLLVVIVLFRKQNILGTVRHATPQGNITGVTSHYLDDTAPLMGG